MFWALMATLGWAFSEYRRSSSVFAVRPRSDHERLRFVRDFIGRYFTYDSATFRTTQTALAYLMTENARAERIQEIDRLNEKVVAASIHQTGRLIRLRALSPAQDHRYEAQVEIRLSEKGAVRIFYSSLLFSLVEPPPSEENPWGLLIDQFVQSVSSSILSSASSSISSSVSPDGKGSATVFDAGVLIQFPCLVENVKLERFTNLRVRLSTFDVSELELAKSQTENRLNPGRAERVIVECVDRHFSFSVRPWSTSPEPRILFASLASDEGSDLKDAQKSLRKKTRVERTLEEQLGFVTE